MGRGSCCHLQRHYRWKHHQRPDSCGGCHSHWCTVLVPQDQFDDGLPRDDDSSPCRIPARHRCIRLVLPGNSAPRLLHKYKKSDPRRDHSISTYRKALLSYSSSPAPSFGEAGRSLRTEIALGISDTLVQSTSLIVSFTVASTTA